MSEQTLNEAIIREWTWKTPAMKRMTLAVVKLALDRARGESEENQFSANDLPEFEHGGPGIAGSIFKTLAKDGVIAPVCGLLDGQPVQKMVRNAGGNNVGLWQLKSEPLALALLSRHDDAATREVFEQQEML